MLTKDEVLRPLTEHRTDEIVVTTMAIVRPWGRISDSDLDFASADSAMGRAADLALGVALARPDRKVICLNGDGSMLMSLGTLATIVDSGADNLILFVLVNGTYEITGNQAVPAAGRIRLAEVANAAGFPRVHAFDEAAAYREAVPALLAGPGPIFVELSVEPGNEGPISRSETEAARYLRSSLKDWSRVVLNALRPS